MRKKVLVFPAGTEISFEIYNALRYAKGIELYGGTSRDDHSCFVYSNLIEGFPYIDDASFLSYLNKVILEYQIDCIFPAHDSVSVFLSKNCNLINALCIISDEKTTCLCRSKKNTYDFFHGEAFVPRYYSDIADVKSLPVFVKPDIGEGSNGALKINDMETLSFELKKNSSLLICEYLPGLEYSVDCFTDRFNKLRVIKMRIRERIRNGISVRSVSVASCEEVNKIAKTINRKLNFRGAWFFQLKKDKNGSYKLLEISPRIPGTMGVSRNAGINFPLLTLFDYYNIDIDIIDNQYSVVVDRAFYNSYRIDIHYNHIYLDFDDTLIVNNRVNTVLLCYLYQSTEKGKHIHLLTKHKGDIYQEFSRFRLSKELFDDIIVISNNEKKIDLIKEKSAIFIDDSFSERQAVKKHCGIPVFDVDMVESLLDWR